MSRIRTIASVGASIAIVTTVAAADWPQFRGPDRDGVSAESGLIDGWPESGPTVAWRVPLGSGYSGVAVADGRLYTLYGRADETLLAAFDAATGGELWKRRIDREWKDRWGDGPRSTPTVDAGRVFAVSARGHLYAVAADSGEVLWRYDLVETFGTEIPKWGLSGSPLVVGDRLLVEVGGESALMVALDKKTGAEVWRSDGGRAGYSSPIVLEMAGQRQVLVFARGEMRALALSDGRTLWRHPWKTSYGVNAAMPIPVPPDRVFLSSGYDEGATLLRLTAVDGGIEATEVWRNREMKNKFSSSVLHDGFLYGFDDKTFKCVDSRTGEPRWRARGLGHGTLIYADGKLVVLSDDGQLVLAAADPDSHRELARAQIFDGRTWTPPTLADGRLYLRDEHELVAIELAADPS